jgi:hypothetical protein
MIDVADCLLYCGYLGGLLGIIQMDDRFVLKKSFGLTWFSDEICFQMEFDFYNIMLGNNGSVDIKRRFYAYCICIDRMT